MLKSHYSAWLQGGKSLLCLCSTRTKLIKRRSAAAEHRSPRHQPTTVSLFTVISFRSRDLILYSVHSNINNEPGLGPTALIVSNTISQVRIPVKYRSDVETDRCIFQSVMNGTVHCSYKTSSKFHSWQIYEKKRELQCRILMNSSRKNRNLLKIYSPSCHPKCRSVCFFIGTDLEKCSITSLHHQ